MSVNGKILVCERIDHKYSVGNVTNDAVELDLNKLEAQYSSYYKKMQILCSDCYRFEACSQCMFYIDNFDKNEKITCPNYTGLNEFQKYLSVNLSQLEKNPILYDEIVNDYIIL